MYIYLKLQRSDCIISKQFPKNADTLVEEFKISKLQICTRIKTKICRWAKDNGNPTDDYVKNGGIELSTMMLASSYYESLKIP